MILKNVGRTAAERGILYFENGVLRKKNVKKFPYKSEKYHKYWAAKINKVFKEKYGEYAACECVVENDVKLASDVMQEGDTYDVFVERVIKSTKHRANILLSEEEIRVRRILTVQEIVGKCRFEYENVGNDYLTIRANILVRGYSFEQVKERQKAILNEIVQRLNADTRFQKIGISPNYFKCRMTYIKKPASIIVVFTLKNNA